MGHYDVSGWNWTEVLLVQEGKICVQSKIVSSSSMRASLATTTYTMTTILISIATLFLFVSSWYVQTAAFSIRPPSSNRFATSLYASDRRSFLSKAAASATPLLLPTIANAAAVPVQRAVGSGESRCRLEGNCLETFELDGAVGWNWGGTERCDARDSQCGPDGRLRDAPLEGQPVPSLPDDLKITNIVELALTIGTGSTATTDVLRIGLYGNACPELVKEMTDLCGRGIVTSQNLLLGAPVRLGQGFGSLTYIRPEERLEFGILSQKTAYAKSIRKSKAPDEFLPQPRPSGDRLNAVRNEQSTRLHNVAGLISVPKDGIGYGNLLGKDDEAYASAFQISASSVSDMDKEGRKVIGQLIDNNSMSALARLAGSPTRKMLPGQSGGTPLIKVSIDECNVSSVKD